MFNDVGAGLRSGSKTALDSVHFGEPFPEYPTGFTEPTLYSSVTTMGSNNLDDNSRLETLMTEALYTNNLTQKETDALSAAGMTSSQVLCTFLPLIFLLSCEMFVSVWQSCNFSTHALLCAYCRVLETVCRGVGRSFLLCFVIGLPHYTSVYLDLTYIFAELLY